MRVVVVNKYAHLTGGADQHCLILAGALRRRGHEVRFLSTLSDRNEEDAGVFVRSSVTHGSRELLSLPAQVRVLERALWNHEAAAGMRRLLAEFRPDLVHAHKLYPQLSAAPVVVAARSGTPIVQTLHDYEMVSASPIDVRGGTWDRDEELWRFRAVNAATLVARKRLHIPAVAAFVAVSRFVERVHAARGFDRMTVLPNFVERSDDGTSIPGFREREGILYVGRLRPEKGVLDVVELARQLPGVRVTLAGAGTLYEVVREQAKTIPNLIVAGFVPNAALRELFRGSRVVVIPSRCQDAGPLVPLEAMAYGTPVVAYANGGLGEYVSDSGGGLVVPADVRALAAAALALYEDGARWADRSRRGRAAVLERHDVDHYAAELEGVYAQVRSRGR